MQTSPKAVGGPARGLEQRQQRRIRILHLFQERVKELAATMLQDDAQDIAALLREVVAMLPSAWQYPASASARIRLDQQEFRAPDFEATPWRQSAAFVTSDGRRGLIEVVYLKEFPQAAEGPFLAEERKLIDFLAEMFRGFMDRKIARQALVASRDSYQEQLRCLAAQLSLTEERERRALAADLHDHIGQTLAAARLKLSALAGTRETEAVRALLDEAIQYTRSLTFELSSPVLYELGLAPALEQLAERMQEKHGLGIEVHDDGAAKPMDDEVRVVLFKAVRELLMNVVKHARAGRATVALRKVDRAVEISVADDGVGCSAEQAAASAGSGGFGLFSIREGLRHCGGEFAIRPRAGRGTEATLRAPLRAADRGH
ncbi:MAG: sensor histidine kinase [Elusimicrobia bacterium]|nr:sensor histidine kinase [Elusimicrobiota bacterium]